MSNNLCFSPCDTVLSPKQAQQRQIRALTIQKIDSEIENIIAINEQQNNQYKDFKQRLALIQGRYVKENNELKQSFAQLSDKYEELEKIYLATKEELDSCTDALQESLQERVKKDKEVVKLKAMIKNQEGLIDEYKRNIYDQLELQKELIRSTFDEDKLKLEKDFNHALLQMEKHYEEKIRKLANEAKAKEYHNEFQQLKKYLRNNKENSEKGGMKKSSSFAKKPISQYSTNDNQQRQDCEKRHYQAIFIP